MYLPVQTGNSEDPLVNRRRKLRLLYIAFTGMITVKESAKQWKCMRIVPILYYKYHKGICFCTALSHDEKYHDV
jgi:hypothetical protein